MTVWQDAAAFIGSGALNAAAAANLAAGSAFAGSGSLNAAAAANLAGRAVLAGQGASAVAAAVALTAGAAFAGSGGFAGSAGQPFQAAGASLAGAGNLGAGTLGILQIGAQLGGAGRIGVRTIGNWYETVTLAGAGTALFRFSAIIAPPALPPNGVFPLSPMRKAALNEAVSILQTGLIALMSNSPVASSAALRQAVGDLSAAAPSEIQGGTVAGDLFNCFDLAVAAGATAPSMANVRAVALAMTPLYVPGQLLATAMVRFCLIEEAQLIAATTYTSRDDVDAAIEFYGSAFDAAIDYASENNDQDAYMALITLEGTVINFLSLTARPLPQMVSYTFAQRMPALWMAQRLYQDPTRTLELVQENKTVHPLFMQRNIRALSA